MGDKILIFGAILCLAAPRAMAHPRQEAHHDATEAVASRSQQGVQPGTSHGNARGRGGYAKSGRYARGGRRGTYATSGGSYVNCVAFAREETGMVISGNANLWWNHAAGLYERGNRPEVGAVMSFMANGRMPLGHVAVVAAVVNSRQVEIDQANWWGPGGGRGRVSRGTPAVDVSPNNDWTAVRVGFGQSGDFGSVYPTNGFIYDRADAGRDLPPHPTNVLLPELNPAPSDLRTRAQREAATQSIKYEEVAEAPAPKSH